MDANDLLDTVNRYAKKIAKSGENVLLIGPPGAGKVMVARRVREHMSALELDERAEVWATWEQARLVRDGKIYEGFSAGLRPFRAPHYTISPAALTGTQRAKNATYRPGEYAPGEIDLANHGVLLLDDFHEHSRQVVDELRRRLDTENAAHVSRMTGHPYHVRVIGTALPCACGFLGSEKRACTCRADFVERYKERLGGQSVGIFQRTVELPDMISGLRPTDLQAERAGLGGADFSLHGAVWLFYRGGSWKMYDPTSSSVFDVGVRDKGAKTERVVNAAVEKFNDQFDNRHVAHEDVRFLTGSRVAGYDPRWD